MDGRSVPGRERKEGWASFQRQGMHGADGPALQVAPAPDGGGRRACVRTAAGREAHRPKEESEDNKIKRRGKSKNKGKHQGGNEAGSTYRTVFPDGHFRPSSPKQRTGAKSSAAQCTPQFARINAAWQSQRKGAASKAAKQRARSRFRRVLLGGSFPRAEEQQGGTAG